MRDLEQPGAIMLEWWLEGADPHSTASQLGVAPGELRRVLNGRANISPELAPQLEAGGWSTAAFWMQLQAAYWPRTPNRSIRRHGSIEPAFP